MFSATKKDFRIDWFSGSGAGGQHRNKHQNCCRITHIPSGMTETCQAHRERTPNQRDAFRRLAKRLIQAHCANEQRERYTSQERVRTYHEPDNRVKDHASGFQQTWAEVIDKNNIAEMIEARREAKIRETLG